MALVRRALGFGLLLCAACGDDDVVLRPGGAANGSPDAGVASDPGTSVASPRIVSFTSSSAKVEQDDPVTLSWTIEGATAADVVELDGASVDGTTSKVVIPARRQTYELIVKSGGIVRDSKRVTVAARGIDLFAGVLEGPGSLDGPGAEASFQNAWEVTYDTAGNAYVTDWGNCVVRKVDALGNVSTLAGSPRACEAKDGKGSLAHFRSPRGVAVGANGTVYVADWLGKGIRAIAPDGTVTTIATMTRPQAILVLPSGDLLVSDGVDGTIRKVTLAGEVTLAYGVENTRAQDDSPATPTFVSVHAMARDAAGNLYAADVCKVRKIAPDGTVSTYAGATTCDEGWGYPDWFYFDPHRTSATFGLLTGIAADAAGNVYVSDREWERIRRIDAVTGNVSVLAGGGSHVYGNDARDGLRGAAAISYPGGLALHPSGDRLAFLDEGAQLLRSVTFAGWVTTVAGQQSRRGRFDGPRGTNRIGSATSFTYEPDGSTVFTDGHNQSIRRVRPDGTVVTFAGGAPGTNDGAGADAQFFYPLSMTSDGKGTQWVAELTGVIRKVESSGVVTTFAGAFAWTSSPAIDGPPGVGRFVSPRAIVRDSKGNLIVSDQKAYSIRRVKPDGTIETIAGGGTYGQFMDGVGKNALIVGANSLAIDADDVIYFDDAWGRTLRKLTPDGTVTTIAGATGETGQVDGPAKQARFNQINALAVDAAKNVYMADMDGHTIRMLSPDGIVSTLAGTSSAHGSRRGRLPGVLHQPLGLSVTPDGDLLVGGVGWIAQVTR